MDFARTLFAVMMCAFLATRAHAQTNAVGNWSAPTNGLQVRLLLVQKVPVFGTRWLVPYLELRNVRDLVAAMEVDCGRGHLKVELVDAEGKPLRSGWSLGRSGFTAELSTIILPMESSMSISLDCKNWGVPRNAAAMVSTDGGAWVLDEKERGKVYLRATLSGEKSEPWYKRWSGQIQTPLVKVDWK